MNPPPFSAPSPAPPLPPLQGVQLESRLGTLPFLLLMAELLLMSNLMLLGASAALATALPHEFRCGPGGAGGQGMLAA